jgi:hypothetical protein
MRSVPEIIEFQLQRLLAEVRADQPPAVARVIVEKTTPESTSTNVEVAVEVARKIAKRRRSTVPVKRIVDAARKRGDCVVIAPDKTVTITTAPVIDESANTVADINPWDSVLDAHQKRPS